MANRNDSDARQHETLPGPGPGPSTAKGGGGRPVEQMVDAAIERIARERTAERGDGNRSGTDRNTLELARRSSGGGTLARREAQVPVLRVPTRLRWKGLDVSDEFRQYAERVARGEELPPFEGRVLAEPNSAFPWGGSLVDAEPKQRSSHPLLWGAAVLVLGLLGWSVALKLEGAETSAPIQTAVGPLAPQTEERPSPASATPPDVVETPTRNAPPPTSASPIEKPSAAPIPVRATPAQAPVTRAVPAAAAKLAGTPPASSLGVSPSAASPSVAVDLARPGALQQAVGAALAGRSAASPAAAATAAAPSKPVREDEFGIMTSVSTAPVAAAPAAAAAPTAAPAPSPAAPAAAKSNGNVGDVSRAGPPSASGVRKEPGSESSAKGSLLVETPSF